eukprot:5187445-Karenia_brevis.AAC.1
MRPDCALQAVLLDEAQRSLAYPFICLAVPPQEFVVASNEGAIGTQAAVHKIFHALLCPRERYHGFVDAIAIWHNFEPANVNIQRAQC